MAKGLLAKKLGMTQVFDSEGKLIPVTVLHTGSNFVSQIKTEEKDGYNSVQLAILSSKEKHLSKAEKNHLAKAKLPPLRHLGEFRGMEALELGSEIKPSQIFAEGDKVKVSGISKGKGYQGVVKRHGFAGGPETHGSRFQRHPGSIGSNTTPARVFKGMRMAGRMGSDFRTVRNLKVVQVKDDSAIIVITGCIPGKDGTVVRIEKI